MKPQRKYLSIISGIAPMGAVGLSLLLGSTLSAGAAQRVANAQRPVAEQDVSERLAAIREAVFTVAGSGLGANHAIRTSNWSGAIGGSTEAGTVVADGDDHGAIGGTSQRHGTISGAV